MNLYLGWAHSAAALADVPVGLILADELGKFPPAVGKEADPMNLLRDRQRIFGRRSKLIKLTSRVDEGDLADVEYNEGDRANTTPSARIAASTISPTIGTWSWTRGRTASCWRRKPTSGVIGHATSARAAASSGTITIVTRRSPPAAGPLKAARSTATVGSRVTMKPRRYAATLNTIRRARTLAYHAERIKQISSRQRYLATWADHDAQDRYEFENQGIKTTPAKKDVHLGIEAVQSTLKVQGDGRPRLFIFDTCKHLVQEMTGYRWAEGTETRDAKDEPLKINDHTCDASAMQSLASKAAPISLKEISHEQK